MNADLRGNRLGVSLTEMLIGVMIVTIMLAMASVGYVRLVRGEHRSSAQAMLDMDVRKSIEMLRENLRLTSVDRIVLYPAGAGPYTAISFPAASDNNGDGMIDLAPGGTNIIWDQTIIYHVWPGTPSQLLRTTFRPRVNTLSDASRIAQLRQVVLNADHGRSFSAETYESTRVIFTNMFSWGLSTSAQPFNGYDTYLHPEETHFGSALLGPGEHALQFRTLMAGAGRGYKIGLDVLRASASGADHEAEEQTYVAAGATARNDDYQNSGAWSGNRQLVLDATGSNQTVTVTLRNDEWEDTNFDSGGTFAQTAVKFDNTDKDYGLSLSGKGVAWLAGQQTRANMTTTTNDLRGYVVRVLVRGASMPDGGAILQSGAFIRASGQPCLVFRVPPNMALYKGWGLLSGRDVCVARVIGTNYTAAINTSSSSLRWLRINRDPSAGSDIVYAYDDNPFTGYSTLYDLSRTNTYAVTFWVWPDTSAGSMPAWPEQNAAAPGCYMTRETVRESEPLKATQLMSTSWTTDYTVSRDLYALEQIVTGYASSGTFVSQVFDTGKTAPVYDATTWVQAKPLGSSVALAFRAGNTADLTAQTWITAASSGSSPVGLSGRYVQYRATLRPDSTAQSTPQVKRVRVGWPGEEKIVNLSGVTTRGPDYGVFDVAIDGRPLMRSVRIDLTIFRDVMTESYGTQRITSAMLAEVEPRNTGK
jgi:hypothetical protein